jgi:hypothetical protein
VSEIEIVYAAETVGVPVEGWAAVESGEAVSASEMVGDVVEARAAVAVGATV